jgi:hypothetical protein
MAGRSSVDKSDKLDLQRCLALLEHYRATDRSAALTDGQVTARWSTEAKALDDKAQASWDMAINILKRLSA